jgi:hypothetical protein
MSSFPVNDLPKLESVHNRDDIYNFDYISDAPKELFDKYKIKNAFFGLTNYKEVGDDIKIQIPRNSMIAKV